jgi:hypothetical protein
MELLIWKVKVLMILIGRVPEGYWSALEVIGVILTVGVAISIPYLQRYLESSSKRNALKRSLIAELYANLRILFLRQELEANFSYKSFELFLENIDLLEKDLVSGKFELLIEMYHGFKHYEYWWREGNLDYHLKEIKFTVLNDFLRLIYAKDRRDLILFLSDLASAEEKNVQQSKRLNELVSYYSNSNSSAFPYAQKSKDLFDNFRDDISKEVYRLRNYYDNSVNYNAIITKAQRDLDLDKVISHILDHILSLPEYKIKKMLEDYDFREKIVSRIFK